MFILVEDSRVSSSTEKLTRLVNLRSVSRIDKDHVTMASGDHMAYVYDNCGYFLGKYESFNKLQKLLTEDK